MRKVHNLALGTQGLSSGLWASWLGLFSVVETGLSQPGERYNWSQRRRKES